MRKLAAVMVVMFLALSAGAGAQGRWYIPASVTSCPNGWTLFEEAPEIDSYRLRIDLPAALSGLPYQDGNPRIDADGFVNVGLFVNAYVTLDANDPQSTIDDLIADGDLVALQRTAGRWCQRD